MVDTEDGLVMRNIERATRDQVDLIFDYHYAPRDCWYVVVVLTFWSRACCTCAP
jgi:hypothetical protein